MGTSYLILAVGPPVEGGDGVAVRIVRCVLPLALVVESLAIPIASATAQVTQPQSAEVASIRIDEPDVPVGGAGVNVPANLWIAPDGGITQDTPLQLTGEITIDEQPLAGRSVLLSAAEAATVDTDAQGRFQVPPLDLGTWEQLTSPRWCGLRAAVQRTGWCGERRAPTCDRRWRCGNAVVAGHVADL